MMYFSTQVSDVDILSKIWKTLLKLCYQQAGNIII